MLVGILCAAAVALSLAWLGVLVAGLSRRITGLDAELATARQRVAALDEVLAQAKRETS